MRTIYILFIRQLKRYWRSKPRLVGSLGQPLLFLVAMGFGFGPIFQQAGAGNYLNFLTPGIIGMTIIFSAVFSGMDIIWDRQFGFLKETLVAPVSRFNIMLGRTIGGATTCMIQGSLVFFIALAIGFRPVSWSLVFPAFLAMFLLALLFTAFGIAIASSLSDFQGFQLIMNFSIMPLFFLSGALFPIENLPIFISVVAMFNPLAYGVDALRIFLSGGGSYNLLLDFAVLSGVTLALVILGGYRFNKMEI